MDRARREILVGGLCSALVLAHDATAAAMVRNLKIEAENIVEARHTKAEVAATELDHAEWKRARPVHIRHYWSGEEASPGRHAEARLLWSGEALSVRFTCRQSEPLVVSASPQTDKKTLGLWDRDVCEIFIAPDASSATHYYEFEAAPTGEWVDLAINWKPEGRETIWNFQSGMKAAGRIKRGSVTMAMRLPWRALGHVPKRDERWRANLFRCVGAGPERGYLAWQPTRTPQPSFHVPQAFGWLVFKG